MEELLAKHFSGNTSEEERQKVEVWREDKSNGEMYLFYKKLWAESVNQDATGPPNDVLNQILQQEPIKMEVVPLWNQKFFKLAAAVVVAVVALFVLLSIFREQPYGQLLAEKTTFDLPDGSKATVQKGGKLSLGDFENKRQVILSGKAFFEVEEDKSKSFFVETIGAVVEVKGTSFMVSNQGDSLKTEVMVESGNVIMSQNPLTFIGQTLSVELEKGQMGEVEIGKRGIRKRRINNENYLAWNTRVLTFRRSTLNEVSQVMKDVYGTWFDYSHPSISKCRLTASFKEKSVEDVASIIADTFGFTYELKDSVVRFEGSSCR